MLKKKGKGAEVLPLWDLLSLFSPLLPILFSLLSDGICTACFSFFLKQKLLLFNFFFLHHASQTSQAWNSGDDLFLTACCVTANQAPQLPHLPAQQCDSPTVWWRIFWTDRLEWYQTTSHAGSTHRSWCHHGPLSQSVALDLFSP